MTQPIWFDHSEAGAPVLNNAAGTLLEVLRACLVNGFNARAVTSIAVASGVATATAAAHGFRADFGKLVQISGAPVAALNGRKQPGNVLTNSFTFPAPGVADGTYTGTISARRAPLGWVQAFTGTNRAIFQRSVPEASAAMLRVLDTAATPASATAARVFAVEAATGADTFTGQTPTEAQVAGGQFWQKGVSSATAKRWHLVGDERGFFLFTEAILAQNTYVPHWFGDVISLRGVDAFPPLVVGNINDNASFYASGGVFHNLASASTFSAQAAFVRGSSQLGSAVRAQVRAGLSNAAFGSNAYPAADNGGNDIVIQRDLLLAEEDATNNYDIRGVMPGLAIPWATQPFTSETVVSALQQEQRSYLALNLGHQSSNGQCLIDLTGPWY